MAPDACSPWPLCARPKCGCDAKCAVAQQELTLALSEKVLPASSPVVRRPEKVRAGSGLGLLMHTHGLAGIRDATLGLVNSLRLLGFIPLALARQQGRDPFFNPRGWSLLRVAQLALVSLGQVVY